MGKKLLEHHNNGVPEYEPSQPAVWDQARLCFPNLCQEETFNQVDILVFHDQAIITLEKDWLIYDNLDEYIWIIKVWLQAAMGPNVLNLTL